MLKILLVFRIMNLNLVIKDLSVDKIDRLKIKCKNCSFWFDHGNIDSIRDLIKTRNLPGIKNFLKSKIFVENQKGRDQDTLKSFLCQGGRVKAAYNDRKCIGVLTAGEYNLFPSLKTFKIYPPDPKSVFLGCIYIEPGYRGLGFEKRLLIELEKDLFKEKVACIESIGKRMSDDIDEKEYENSRLIPFKFLINNGFYLKKNDEIYPLLRLDIRSIASVFKERKLSLGKLAYKKEVRSPVTIKTK